MPRVRILVLLGLLAWASFAFWHTVKPLPAGTHVATLAARLAESQVDVIDDSSNPQELTALEIAALDRAEQLVILDLCPVTPAIARHLLTRKRQRPNLKVVIVADPLNEAYGGTPAEYFVALERAGIIVARIRLERLRDSRPLYSGLWRLAIGWWSNPFDEAPGRSTLLSSLRHFNFKRDHRRLMVADDGSGGWLSMISGEGDVGLELRGALAHEIVESEMQIARWSTDDDRLPSAPPTAEARGLGSIDARYLTEGAIESALLDAVAASASGDQISIAANAVSDRRLISAALSAAARGVRLEVLLDPDAEPNRAVAAELERDGGGRIEVRWFAAHQALAHTALAIIRHRNELWVNVGAADFTRPSLDDFNLGAALELRLPASAGAARALAGHFARQWSSAAAYGRYADESRGAYWQYRVLEAGGLAAF